MLANYLSKVLFWRWFVKKINIRRQNGRIVYINFVCSSFCIYVFNMWCIINKINNENDALLFDTQQNDLIPSSYFNLINNRILSKNNRSKINPQVQINSLNSQIDKIIINPSLIAYKFISNYNYVVN